MPCQAADVEAFRSHSGNTPEISKEMPCQAADVDACTSPSGNTPERQFTTHVISRHFTTVRKPSRLHPVSDLQHSLLPDEHVETVDSHWR
ncbi:hypothetical protein ILYODFUR_039183 [Ilyodon furcidens]|uniref:Uncharacterized protein n=1 Tax=Ilyodon furcidens TaxID=33524 RepID=A0ABV0TS94_9TELE